MIPEFTDEEKLVIKRFRDTEAFKLDNQSDFKTLRQCFKASKELYNCLKYFDSRVSRFACFNSYEQKNYAMRRRYVYPQEYYSFKSFGVDITVYRDNRNKVFFVGTDHFFPKTFKREGNFNSDTMARYGSESSLSLAITNWQKIVFEYLDGAYSLGL